MTLGVGTTADDLGLVTCLGLDVVKVSPWNVSQELQSQPPESAMVSALTPFRLHWG